MVYPLQKTVWQFFRRLNTELPFDLAIPLLGTYSEKLETHVHTKLIHKCSQQHQKVETTHISYQLMNGYMKCGVSLQWNIIWLEKGMKC